MDGCVPVHLGFSSVGIASSGKMSILITETNAGRIHLPHDQMIPWDLVSFLSQLSICVQNYLFLFAAHMEMHFEFFVFAPIQRSLQLQEFPSQIDWVSKQNLFTIAALS